MIWLSGPPGAGKSTTAQLLGKHDNYVYFEADAMAGYLNPFVPNDVENPTIAAFRQKPLKVKYGVLEMAKYDVPTFAENHIFVNISNFTCICTELSVFS